MKRLLLFLLSQEFSELVKVVLKLRSRYTEDPRPRVTTFTSEWEQGLTTPTTVHRGSGRTGTDRQLTKERVKWKKKVVRGLVP